MEHELDRPGDLDIVLERRGGEGEDAPHQVRAAVAPEADDAHAPAGMGIVEDVVVPSAPGLTRASAPSLSEPTLPLGPWPR